MRDGRVSAAGQVQHPARALGGSVQFARHGLPAVEPALNLLVEVHGQHRFQMAFAVASTAGLASLTAPRRLTARTT